MTAWWQGPLLGFDLETTHADPWDARIVTASCVYQASPEEMPSAWNWVADPGIEIPAEAAAIHGYTTQRAKEEGWELAFVVEEVALTLVDAMQKGIPVVAFNASYDFTVMTHEMARLGHTNFESQLWRPIGPIIDPHVIDKAAEKYRPGARKLGDTMEHYGIVLENAHTAEADATGALLLARAVARKHEPIGLASAQTIHGWTVNWRAQQVQSLIEYRAQRGEVLKASPDWPIQRSRA